MTEPRTRTEAIIAALKEDLPTERDDARVRRKLATLGLTVSATLGAAELAQAASATSAKAVTTVKATATSSAPAAAGSCGAASTVTATKVSSLLGAWAASTTGAKLAVVSLALAGTAYPIANRWSAAPTSVSAPLSPKPLSPTPLSPTPLSATPLPPTPLSSSAADIAEQNAGGLDESSKAPVPPAEAIVSPLPSTVRLNPNANRRENVRSTSLDNDSQHRNSTTVGHQSPRLPAQASDVLLGQETTLIERALIATRNHDTVAAARLLEEHERRFPSGVLAKERERLRGSLE